MYERRAFLLQMIRNGKKNASITPSSRFLAKEMLKGIDRNFIHTVIELGAGTGVFTQYLLKYAHPGTKIIVIEVDEVYIKILQKKFRNAIILAHDDVKNIDAIRQKYGIEKIDLIVSGLPFVPAESIHEELKRYVSQGTIFRTFTYMPREFKKIYAGFPLHKVGFTFLNLPPARVYGIN